MSAILEPRSRFTHHVVLKTAPVQAASVQKLEEIILTKARDLRRGSITQG